MDRESLPLEALVHRLTETPADFLSPPPQIHLSAIVRDLLERLSPSALPPSPIDVAPFSQIGGGTDAKRCAITLLLCWLLDDSWFKEQALDRTLVLTLLTEVPRELAASSPSPQLVGDPERREELARITLARLGYRPAGETKAQAQDRLTSISTTERTRLLAASRVAEERARKIREELARKAAQEAADKWTRE